MYSLEFETIQVKGSSSTIKRAKVIGGWLILVTDKLTEYQERHTGGYGFRTSTTFIPDPEHKWEND